MPRLGLACCTTPAAFSPRVLNKATVPSFGCCFPLSQWHSIFVLQGPEWIRNKCPGRPPPPGRSQKPCVAAAIESYRIFLTGLKGLLVRQTGLGVLLSQFGNICPASCQRRLPFRHMSSKAQQVINTDLTPKGPLVSHPSAVVCDIPCCRLLRDPSPKWQLTFSRMIRSLREVNIQA